MHTHIHTHTQNNNNNSQREYFILFFKFIFFLINRRWTKRDHSRQQLNNYWLMDNNFVVGGGNSFPFSFFRFFFLHRFVIERVGAAVGYTYRHCVYSGCIVKIVIIGTYSRCVMYIYRCSGIDCCGWFNILFPAFYIYTRLCAIMVTV